jgi:biopolymer transport protein TolR
MKRRDRPQSLMTEINITPFTDVILVLLIIFIVATPLISQNQIEVKLPLVSKEEQPALQENKQVFITITGEGVVYFENKVLTTSELKKKIAEMMTKDKDTKFIVAADKSCRFQEVVKVIDILKDAGAQSLNIATRPETN